LNLLSSLSYNVLMIFLKGRPAQADFPNVFFSPL